MCHWPEWLSTKREKEKFHFLGAVFSDVPFPIPNQHRCQHRCSQQRELFHSDSPSIFVGAGFWFFAYKLQICTIYTNLQWKALVQISKEFFFSLFFPLWLQCSNLMLSLCFWDDENLVWGCIASKLSVVFGGTQIAWAQPQDLLAGSPGMGQVSRTLCDLPDIYISLAPKPWEIIEKEEFGSVISRRIQTRTFSVSSSTQTWKAMLRFLTLVWSHFSPKNLSLLWVCLHWMRCPGVFGRILLKKKSHVQIVMLLY